MKYLSRLLVLMLLSTAAINCMESNEPIRLYLEETPPQINTEPELSNSAEMFKKHSKELKATMNKKNAKLCCILGLIPPFCCAPCAWPAAGYFWCKAHKK